MKPAVNNLPEAFEKSEPRTDEEYEAVCRTLLEEIKRNLEGAEEDRREIRRLGEESRASVERIRAMPPFQWPDASSRRTISPRVHPSAVVHPAAELGAGVEIGPFCVVNAGVRLGERCRLLSHVVLDGPATIGADNVFYPFSAVGGRTQDLKYAGEPTFLEIGDNNTFRESVTVHRGTAPGGVTRIGSRGNFLAYSHIAHDCTVGDDVIFSNNGTIAGHVEVGARAIIGGLTAVHQFCRVGTLAITGGCTKIVQDVPPFFIADGNPAEVRGVNVVGLERAGVGPETARALREAYRIVYRANLNTAQAVERLQAELGEWAEVRALVEFITSSQRGIVR